MLNKNSKPEFIIFVLSVPVTFVCVPLELSCHCW